MKLPQFIVGALAVVALCVQAQQESGPAVAKPLALQFNESNFHTNQLQGAKASAGVDDWYLSNGVVCAAISDVEHESELSTGGGALIDLGFCGRKDDQFVLYQDLLNADRATPFLPKSVSASHADNSATITVTGQNDGLNYIAQYSLDSTTPDRLTIRKSISRVSAGATMSIFASAMMVTETLTQYDLSLSGHSKSRGFQHREGDEGMLSILDEVNASNWLIFGSRDHSAPPISYALGIDAAYLLSADGEREQLPHFFRGGVNAGISATFSGPFWFGEPHELGTEDLLQSLVMDLDIGEELILEQQILLTPSAEIAAVTDQLWTEHPKVSGNTSRGGVAIHIADKDGNPVTQSRSKSDGSFSLHLPPGEYSAAFKIAGDESQRTTFTVGGTALQLPDPGLPKTAQLTLPTGEIMRLTFIALGDTPKTSLEHDGLNYSVKKADGELWPSHHPTRDLFLIGNKFDPREISLPAGKYEVIASRGPEYSAQKVTVELSRGEQTQLTIDAPRRTTSTPNHISADLHVHTSPSFDTSLGIAGRIKGYLAQGGEILVSTEHETIYDFSEDIAQLELQSLLHTITGTEITSEVASKEAPYTLGHANAFPMVADVQAFRRGAPNNEGRRWRDVAAHLQQLNPKPILQLNHPRYLPLALGEGNEIENQAYFSHLSTAGESYNPYLPLTSAPNNILLEKDPNTGLSDLNFDAIEMFNSANSKNKEGNLEVYNAIRQDWFSLLRQGVKMTATANSDSHSNHANDIVLAARNMVYLGSEKTGSYSSEAFVDAIRKGASYGTTGPLLDVSIDNKHAGGYRRRHTPGAQCGRSNRQLG